MAIQAPGKLPQLTQQQEDLMIVDNLLYQEPHRQREYSIIFNNPLYQEQPIPEQNFYQNEPLHPEWSEEGPHKSAL